VVGVAGTRTVLFTGLRASTDLRVRIGDDAVEVATAHQAAITAQGRR
jgi:hypothetical protein